jgi:hypothetical protein
MQELIEQHGNVFSLKQTGYEFVPKSKNQLFDDVTNSEIETFKADRD